MRVWSCLDSSVLVDAGLLLSRGLVGTFPGVGSENVMLLFLCSALGPKRLAAPSARGARWVRWVLVLANTQVSVNTSQPELSLGCWNDPFVLLFVVLGSEGVPQRRLGFLGTVLARLDVVVLAEIWNEVVHLVSILRGMLVLGAAGAAADGIASGSQSNIALSSCKLEFHLFLWNNVFAILVLLWSPGSKFALGGGRVLLSSVDVVVRTVVGHLIVLGPWVRWRLGPRVGFASQRGAGRHRAVVRVSFVLRLSLGVSMTHMVLFAEFRWVRVVLLSELMIRQRLLERCEWVILVGESRLLMLRMLTLRMASLLFPMALLCSSVGWLHVPLAALLLDETLRVNQVGIIGLHCWRWLMLLDLGRLLSLKSLLASFSVGSLGLLVLLMSWFLLVFFLGL